MRVMPSGLFIGLFSFRFTIFRTFIGPGLLLRPGCYPDAVREMVGGEHPIRWRSGVAEKLKLGHTNFFAFGGIRKSPPATVPQITAERTRSSFGPCDVVRVNLRKGNW